MTEAKRVLVLDCGSITNPDATADMAALTAAMGAATTEDVKGVGWTRGRGASSSSNSDMDATRYWTTALTEAGSSVTPAAVDAASDACTPC